MTTTKNRTSLFITEVSKETQRRRLERYPMVWRRREGRTLENENENEGKEGGKAGGWHGEP